jgi:hypothetical protein
VGFASKQRSLIGEFPERLAELAVKLRGLGNSGRHVQVWVEGGGARRISSAGMDRATAVRQRLDSRAGDARITWHVTNRGTGATAAPVRNQQPQRPQQVVVLWTATPVDAHTGYAMMAPRLAGFVTRTALGEEEIHADHVAP